MSQPVDAAARVDELRSLIAYHNERYHTLDSPETLVKLGAILGRIRLVSSDAVLTAAEECFNRIVDLYAKPNRTMAEIFTTLHSGEFEALKHFSDACRVELRKYSAY